MPQTCFPVSTVKVDSGLSVQGREQRRASGAADGSYRLFPELGSLEVAVEVTGSAPMINVTDATVGTVIENKQILELPLNGRNFINLVSLSPNVSSDWAGGGVAALPDGRVAIARRRISRLPVSAANTTSTRSTASSIRTSTSIPTPSCPRSTASRNSRCRQASTRPNSGARWHR